jgi:uncharacterized membrane protein
METHEQESLRRSSSLIAQSLKARADNRRTVAERLADRMTAGFGSMRFLIANVIWFAVWLVINTGLIPSLPAFDPFPFPLLTTIVSLEAIVLAIVVLISENRAAKISELREEIDLHMDVIAEREITRILQLVILLLDKEKVDYPKDGVLKEMLRTTDTEKLARSLEGEVMK